MHEQGRMQGEGTSSVARSAGSRTTRDPVQRFEVSLARAFGGAIFFSLPLLMTMEMWWLGFYMDRLRLALFMLVMIPVLIGLSHLSGIRTNTSWTDDVADAFVAWAVAFAAASVVLLIFNVINLSEMPLREIVGKVSLQAVPGAFGAMLANSQLGSAGEKGPQKEEREERGGFASEMFLMFAGALFLGFNVAPTEEMILIAFKMSNWHAIALAVTTVLMMHGFVYSANFRGTPSRQGAPGLSLFLRFSLPGYAISLLASAYILWTFGRFEDHVFSMHVLMSITLGFPAGLGAAAARLIL